jgi:hypothetical protein
MTLVSAVVNTPRVIAYFAKQNALCEAIPNPLPQFASSPTTHLTPLAPKLKKEYNGDIKVIPYRWKETAYRSIHGFYTDT